MTEAQERVLEVLYDFQGEPCGIVDIIEYTGTTRTAVREHVHNLVKAKLVKSTPGRHRALRITNKGLAALEGE